MGKEGANEFLAKLNEIFQKKEVVVSGIDQSKPDDRALALQALLRGKNEEQYYLIFEGLKNTAISTTDKDERDRLNDLLHGVMELGEKNLDIDWH